MVKSHYNKNANKNLDTASSYKDLLDIIKARNNNACYYLLDDVLYNTQYEWTSEQMDVLETIWNILVGEYKEGDK